MLAVADGKEGFEPIATSEKVARSSSRQARIGVAWRRPPSEHRWWPAVFLAIFMLFAAVWWRRSYLKVARSEVSEDLEHLCSGPMIQSVVSTECCSPGHRGVYKLRDAYGAELEMVFHAVSPNPFVQATLGMKDGFGIITNSRSQTMVNVSFVSGQEPLRLPYFAISFYHLVHSHLLKHGGKSVKVIGNWSDVVILKQSRLKVSTAENAVSFKAAKSSSHASPKDPQKLTMGQLTQAATVRFVDVSTFQIQFEVGSDEFHGFLFSTSAALLCGAREQPPLQFLLNPSMFKMSDSTENRYVIKNVDQSLFHQWLVEKGDKINVGDKIYRVAVLQGLQDVVSEVSGKVIQFQTVLPGDFLQPGLPMLILDTTGINWIFIAICTGVVIVCILLVVLCWRCCRKAPEDEEKTYLKRVTLEFETETNWVRQVEWTYQPLGLGFYEDTIPMRVAYVGEDARHMGVVRGDVLVGASSDPSDGVIKVMGGVDFENAWKDLKARVDRLPPAPRLVLRFQSDLGPYSLTLTWRTKPLGLHFSDDVPIRVTEVLEEAAHLNVEVGDMLVGYGLAVHQLQSVEGRTAKEVLQYIYDHIEVLPDGARVVINLEKFDKSVESFTWSAQPIGVRFTSSLPITVHEVKSLLAEEKGVRKGYVLKSFGDDKRLLHVEELVKKGKQADEILECLQRFLEKMPLYREEKGIELMTGRV